MKDPFRRFVSECKKSFDFLVADYGFQSPSEQEYGRERVVEFVKEGVTVSISFDWDTIFVLIKRPYSEERGEKKRNNRFFLDELILLSNPKSMLIDLQRRGRWNEQKIREVLSAYAKALKEYGTEILMGGFDLLPKILLERQKKST